MESSSIGPSEEEEAFRYVGQGGGGPGIPDIGLVGRLAPEALKKILWPTLGRDFPAKLELRGGFRVPLVGVDVHNEVWVAPRSARSPKDRQQVIQEVAGGRKF